VLHAVLAGLKEAGLTSRDVIVYNRYRQETLDAGIDKWVPQGVHMEFGSAAYNDRQLDMDGYDPDHYMEMVGVVTVHVELSIVVSRRAELHVDALRHPLVDSRIERLLPVAVVDDDVAAG